MSGARERIEKWIEATRKVTRASSRSVIEIDESKEQGDARRSSIGAIALESGLSRDGVVLALRRCLEVDRAPAELSRFLENPRLVAIGERSTVGVVLSSTVAIAAFRAVAWALAQSPRVIVRPSRGCRALVSAIVEATPGIVDLAAPSDDPEADLRSLVASLPPRAALHVYGGSEAMAATRQATEKRNDLHVELHGPGFGVVVARSADVVEKAAAIALDVAAFDQRGCLSPRLALVVGEGSTSAAALHEALGLLDAGVCPRGELDERERVAARLACEAARFQGRALEGAGHAVLDLGHAPGAPIGPIGRILPIVAIHDVDEAIDRLRPFASQLTQIATIDAWRDRLSTIASTCALGAMQTPPFDGPVDRRVR